MGQFYIDADSYGFLVAPGVGVFKKSALEISDSSASFLHTCWAPPSAEKQTSSFLKIFSISFFGFSLD